jgi:hypothetical protein
VQLNLHEQMADGRVEHLETQDRDKFQIFCNKSNCLLLQKV